MVTLAPGRYYGVLNIDTKQSISYVGEGENAEDVVVEGLVVSGHSSAEVHISFANITFAEHKPSMPITPMQCLSLTTVSFAPQK